MKSCEEYEIELSSLLDGEAAPEVAAEAVEHAFTCESCGAFFRAARRLAAPARALAAEEGALSEGRAEELWLEVRRLASGVTDEPGSSRRRSRWARGLRAAALVAVGLGGGYLLSALGSAGAPPATGSTGVATPAAVRAGTSKDARRFVAHADELMRAEPRYQRAMLEILRLVPALETGEGLGHEESRPFVRARTVDDGAFQGVL